MATFEQEVDQAVKHQDPNFKVEHVAAQFTAFVQDSDAVNQLDEARRYLQIPEPVKFMPGSLSAVHVYYIGQMSFGVSILRDQITVDAGDRRYRGARSYGLVVAPGYHSPHAPHQRYLCTRVSYGDRPQSEIQASGEDCTNDHQRPDPFKRNYTDKGTCFPMDQSPAKLRDALHEQLVLTCAWAKINGKSIDQVVAPHALELQRLADQGLLYDNERALIKAVQLEYDTAHPAKPGLFTGIFSGLRNLARPT